mgnify:CR=1 FL=1
MNEDQPYFPQAVTLEEAWVRARNTWTLAQRHGTLEEGDLMAVGELRRHVKLIDEGGVPLDVVNKAINAAVADASNGARQTAEYWKAEHLAGNDRIAMLETSNAHFTERIIELEADLAAAQAERDALTKAWNCAKQQNAHDMLLSGDEIHQHDAAITKAREGE